MAKVLDCTFRDGGYYTNWDFNPELVEKYLQAMDRSRVDAIEIGFRFSPKNKFLGAFAYSTDSFLSGLDFPDIPIGVMVNGNDVNISSFSKVDKSPIDRVRLALHFGKISACESTAKDIKNLGYELGVNMMQAAGKSDSDVLHAVKTIRDWRVVDFLYFADSLGDMSPDDVSKMMRIIQSEWDGPIGFHGHDNKGLALINSIAAIKHGAAWVDGTTLGMGRGAGNTRTEYLLTELNGYSPDQIFHIVMSDFSDLQKEHGWGPSLPYYLSALYGIHPTYIQEMTSSLQYSTSQMLEGINRLRSLDSNSYSKKSLDEALFGEGIDVKGQWSSDSWVSGRDVLVIAAGEGSVKYRSALVDYIKRCQPFVVHLNCNSGFPNDLIDTYAACHKTRLMTEIHKYVSLNKPILMPRALVKDSCGLNILDYGVKIQSGNWESRLKGCVIPQMLVAPYVFAALKSGGASRILLAGFDGYEKHDPRQVAMNEVFGMYKGPPLVSITPSSYNISKSSVYIL